MGTGGQVCYRWTLEVIMSRPTLKSALGPRPTIQETALLAVAGVGAGIVLVLLAALSLAPLATAVISGLSR